MPDVMAFRTGGGDGARGTAGFDATVAAPARVYDYWLGGKDNFAADRVAADETIAAYPAIRSSARANRAFLVRAVSYLAGARGIGQFLDIGAGLPVPGPVVSSYPKMPPGAILCRPRCNGRRPH